MATLSTTRNYGDGEILLESDLDTFLDDIETFLNTTKINDDNIQDAGINAATKLANSSITNAKIAPDAVTTSKIADDAVDRTKIASDVAGLGLNQNANGSLEIPINGVSTSMLQNSSVDDQKLANGAVVAGKLGASLIGGGLRVNGSSQLEVNPESGGGLEINGSSRVQIADAAVTLSMLAGFSFGATGNVGESASLGSSASNVGNTSINLFVPANGYVIALFLAAGGEYSNTGAQGARHGSRFSCDNPGNARLGLAAGSFSRSIATVTGSEQEISLHTAWVQNTGSAGTLTVRLQWFTDNTGPQTGNFSGQILYFVLPGA